MGLSVVGDVRSAGEMEAKLNAALQQYVSNPSKENKLYYDDLLLAWKRHDWAIARALALLDQRPQRPPKYSRLDSQNGSDILDSATAAKLFEGNFEEGEVRLAGTMLTITWNAEPFTLAGQGVIYTVYQDNMYYTRASIKNVIDDGGTAFVTNFFQEYHNNHLVSMGGLLQIFLQNEGGQTIPATQALAQIFYYPEP